MKDLAGKPVLDHVLHRCAAIPGIVEVCCATTDLTEDDVIAQHVARLGYPVIRGAAIDVLARYVTAARSLAADIVLRVTSDCPLIDPAICASVMGARAAVGAAYATNNMPPSWPKGLDCEAFTMDALERADRGATHPEDREHVSPYTRREGPVVNVLCPEPGIDHLRWTIDTAADLALLRVLLLLMPKGPDSWPYTVPLALMRSNPDLCRVNA
jgi:spore coat polysaccharide biosynthesis protein SpsF